MTQLPPQVLRFLSWLKKTEGRDKLYRLVAYGSKIPIHLLKQNGGNQDVIERLQKGAKSVGMTRKLMRMFKSLEFLNDLLKAKSQDIYVQILNYLKNSFLMVWMLLDHYQWLCKAGYFVMFDEKLVSKLHSKAWFLGLLSNITLEFYKLQTVLEYKSGKKMVKSLLDIMVPIARLEWLPINDGIVGVSGTITSCMGIYDTY